MMNELPSLTGTFNPQTTGKLMGKLKWDVQREGNVVVKNVIVSNIHEQGRALLAKTALDNLGALSALEAHLTQIAPSGEERYRQIVDAYALGAAQKIWRW
jgi:hypothetical protein